MADIHVSVAMVAVLLLSIQGGATSAPRCPPRCTCYSGSSDVDCNYCGLRDVPSPSSIPDCVQRFRLKSNFISRIPARAFESLTELRYLDLSTNAITFLDNHTFFGLGKLEFLSISRNGIEVIKGNSFEPLSSLKTLLLNENQIKVIDAQGFLGLVHLVTLDLSNNSIQELQKGLFFDVQALSEIKLTMNQISQIAPGVFEGLSALSTFNLSFNQISDLDRGAFVGVSESMRTLYLDYNCLITVPSGVFHDFTSLEGISFFGNTIQTIYTDSFLNLPSLTWLNMSRNQISSLEPKTFLTLAELEFMDVSNNHLQTIKAFTFMGLRQMAELNLEFNRIRVLESFSFFGCSSLSVLRLGDNQIHTIEPRAFEGAYFITALQLENNNLTLWPSEASKSFRFLHTIVLSNNLIGELQSEAFGGMVHLQACHVGQNRITKIREGAFSDLVKLRFLDLSRNFLSELEPNVLHLPKLQTLNVSGNSIYDISCDTFNGTEALEVLDLKDNQLSSVPSCALGNVPLLTVLDLSNNVVHNVDKGAFVKLDNLKELYIQANRITSVHPLAFLQLRELRVVNLQNNSLTSCDTQWFSDCPALEYLSLSNNEIQAINHRFFSEARPLKTFSAQGNPWCCNCSNFWLTENKSIVDSGLHGLYVCHTPVELRGANAFRAVGGLPCSVPKVTQIQEARNCAVGEEESLCLRCKATGFPELKVHWILPNRTKVQAGFDPGLKSYTLKLPAEEPVPGIYTCRAINEIGVDELQISVNILTMLSVMIPHSYVAMEINSAVNLTCLAQGYPEPSVKWVTPLGSQHLGYQFFIESASRGDVGTYYCVANNSQTSINGTAYVDFVRPPEIQDKPANFSLFAGHSVVLPCFALGFPPPHVAWRLPSLQHTDFTANQGRLKVVEEGGLSIDDLLRSDAGVYVCEAVNVAGRDSIQHTLTVLERLPFAPSSESKKHYKPFIVALIALLALSGIASLCSLSLCKKDRTKIIQVQPISEKILPALTNDSEIAF